MVYFAYLFLFAGLNSAEKRNVLMLLLLFIGAAAFWSGFDQSAGSLTIFTRDYVDLTFGSFTGLKNVMPSPLEDIYLTNNEEIVKMVTQKNLRKNRQKS